MKPSIRVFAAALCIWAAAYGTPAQARGWRCVRFRVVDAATRLDVPAGRIVLDDGRHPPVILLTGYTNSGSSPVFDVVDWRLAESDRKEGVTVVTLPAGAAVTIQSQTTPPVKDIFIRVTASRIQLRAGDTSTGARIEQKQIDTFVNRTSGDTRALTQGKASVASDSAGQQHIRGEHADISYVVDGVPLPDTLSGRQGSIVVPSTIESLEMLTGGFAPEFGGQTAAVLNIFTLPGTRRAKSDLTLQGGEFATTNGNFSTVGPLGKRGSYVIDLSGTRTANALEPQQPDDQTAHNEGSGQNYFTKFRFAPGVRDTMTLTLSQTPGTLQINNRTGLPASFANVGQGFGFLGLRNANGVRPDVTAGNAGSLGAAPMALPSQQAAGMKIDQSEVSEFATFSWRRRLRSRDTSLLSFTFLHSGQELNNRNPAVNVLDLPVDNSIEFNPLARRNVHHVQVTGSVTAPRRKHEIKAGFLLDEQSGTESYQLTPASRLALDDLAALAPNLVPAGSVQRDAGGLPVLDVNGNPVYLPSSSTVPVLRLNRTGFYRAAYVQDTWKPSRSFTFNYGLRLDWFRQAQNLASAEVDTAHLSPRLNFSYAPDRLTVLRWSYNRLFNTPPLAQGAIIGAPIVPERLNQYDVSVQREIKPGQTVGLAYYYKQIRDQIDTGLLVPGSWLGLYSAINFQFGSVHGLEFTYEVSPPKGVGWNAYFNYTYSTAKPNGVDSAGAPVPEFNDHDQRHTIGAGFAYLFKGGASAAITVAWGSGLASSPVTPGGPRIPRTQVDMRLTTGPRLFHGRGGLSLDATNLFDARTVINFQSGFSGTRFMQARRILLSAFGTF